MKTFIFACLMLAISASNAAAQSMAFAKKPVSRDQFAQAIQMDNSNVLSVPCMNILAVTRHVFQYTSARTCAELGAFVKGLYVASCPQEQATLAGVLNGIVEINGKRQLGKKEKCLYDVKAAQWIAVLPGGSIITKPLPPLGTKKEKPNPGNVTASGGSTSLSPRVEAQRRPVGRAFLNESITSSAQYADIILTCRTNEQIKKGITSPAINVSCEELVDSFNRNPAFVDINKVKEVSELANYIRSLEWRNCPQVRTHIARVVDGKVDMEYERNLRQGEMCLFDRGANLYISSMVCGQWLGDSLTIIKRVVEDTPLSTSVAPSVNPLQDSADKAVQAWSSGVSRREPEPVLIKPERGSWLKRNRKWIIPVAIGVGAGAACAILLGTDKNTNEQYISITLALR